MDYLDDSCKRKIFKMIVSWHRVLKIIGLVGSGLGLLSIMVLTSFDAISRKVGMPVPGIYEVNELILATTVFCGLAYAQMHGRHVNIDFLTIKLPPKTQAQLKQVMLLFTLVFLVVLTWSTFRAALYAYTSGDTWSDLPVPLPIWTVKAVLPFGCLLISIEILIELVKQVRLVSRDNKAQIRQEI
jgi:TRAP-type transport system small permease protein